jgi:uncharacterized membrane protein YgaE (UPF0421/DUF939 family)
MEANERKKIHGETGENPQTFYEKLIGRLEFRIAFKTGIAAALSLYLGVAFAHWLDRPDTLISGTWCVISTFVVLQAHLGSTYRAAWIRFLGVLIGSFMGGLFTSLFGSNAITLGISIILTMLVCSLFQLKESIRIACLSLCIIMILWGLHPSTSPWIFGLYRFLDSCLGIGVAVLVSHTLWPAQATQKLRLSIADTIQLVIHLFEMELTPKSQLAHFGRIHQTLINDIEQMIAKANQFLADSELELLSKTKRIEEWANVIDHLNNIFQSTKELDTYHKSDLQRILDQDLKDKLESTINTVLKTFHILINRLKRSHSDPPSSELSESVAILNEELARFRTTRTTRKFNRQEVEKFFVFFYNLRLVIEELIKMEERTYQLLSRS